MFRRFSANFAVFSIFVDSLLVALGLYLATLARSFFNGLPFVQDFSLPPLAVELYLLFPLLWVLILMLFSVYDGRKNLRVADEFSSLTLGSLLALITLAGVLYLSYRDVSRFLFLSFVFISYAFLILWRAAARLAFRWNWMRESECRHVLILGAGKTGRALADAIQRHKQFGLVLVGYLDDDPAKRAASGKILGTIDQARTVVNQHRIDDVIIALPLSAHARLNQVVTELHDLPVRVWVIPDYFSLSMHRASIEEFAGIPMLDLRAPALSEYQRMVKRAFDLLIILLILPFVAPVAVLIALCIRLDSPGPVLFRQERVGENGRIFRMVKFRTMVADAEARRAAVEKQDEKGNIIHKSADDPRVTRIGRFLRHSSLDEMPQIINVIKGEMSLVGPRPEMPYLVEKYEPWQRKRFVVPQGISGWWQINGRSDKMMHLHTEEDLYYVQHYSIWLDIQILMKTLWVVVRGRGAY